MIIIAKLKGYDVLIQVTIYYKPTGYGILVKVTVY